MSLPAPSLAIDPFGAAFLSDPFGHHGALRDAGPVVWFERYQCFGMARYAEVKEALNAWETFISSRGVGLSDFSKEAPWRPPSLLLEADPPLHGRTRGLMTRIASLAGLRSKAPEWLSVAEDTVAKLPASQPFDAVEHLAEAFPLRVFPELIGLQDSGRENLIPYATSVFNAFGPRNQLVEDSLAAATTASAWIDESCRRENLKPGGWGMQVFEAADRGDCSADEAARLIRSFLSAGVDTTVNGIANLIYCLAAHPEQWAMLRNQPQLARRAIEESLRWGGVIQTFFRTTSKAIVIADTVIPEGSKVILFLASANRDPLQWENPDSFDLRRNASGHVGFGFGIHQCLGQMVARLEMEAVLQAMLHQIGEIKLTEPPTRRLNNTLFAMGSLPIQITRIR